MTRWCSISACRRWTGCRCSRNGAGPARPCRCCCSPPATAGATRCRASMPAPTTISPSPSTWKNCWRGSGRWSAAPPGMPSNEITAGPVRLDVKAGKVTVDGQAIKLTSHELRLLSYLMHHKGKVVSRTELTEHLYDQDFDRDSNTIEVFVGRLRKKLPEEVHPDGARARLPDHRRLSRRCRRARSPSRCSGSRPGGWSWRWLGRRSC